ERERPVALVRESESHCRRLPPPVRDPSDEIPVDPVDPERSQERDLGLRVAPAPPDHRRGVIAVLGVRVIDLEERIPRVPSDLRGVRLVRHGTSRVCEDLLDPGLVLRLRAGLEDARSRPRARGGSRCREPGRKTAGPAEPPLAPPPPPLFLSLAFLPLLLPLALEPPSHDR